MITVMPERIIFGIFSSNEKSNSYRFVVADTNSIDPSKFYV